MADVSSALCERRRGGGGGRRKTTRRPGKEEEEEEERAAAAAAMNPCLQRSSSLNDLCHCRRIRPPKVSTWYKKIML